MKLALISPKGSLLGRNVAFVDFLKQSSEMEFYRQYWSGLGLGLLVIGALTPQDVELELIDENIEQIDFRKNYDLVAITAFTQQATRAYEIARIFREKDIKVVMGGIHATTLPNEAGLYVDSVVVGEAENLWPKLIDDFRENRLSPQYSSRWEVDLKKSPIPKYELLAEKPYKIIWLQTTRGCPHDCSFCCASRIYGSQYRHKHIDQVLEEIRLIKKIKKHSLIGFADDNLLCDKEYSEKFLERIVDVKIRWIGQSDISIAKNESLLRLIKKSGCVALFIGFESIIEENLKGLDSSDWKMRQLSNYGDYIRSIQNNGIGIIGTFIVGFDNDDDTIFEKLTDFITGNRLAGAQIAALTPFPGTRMRDELQHEGRILDTSWGNYTFYDVNIRPKNMSPEELEKGILEVFKNLYSTGVAGNKRTYFREIFSNIHKMRYPRITGKI